VDDVAGVLEAARDAYRRHDWAAARDRFHTARAVGELAPATWTPWPTPPGGSATSRRRRPSLRRPTAAT
jgi:hypothetical protein